MSIIITIIIALLLVLIGWLWHNLGNIDKTKKIKLIIGGIIVVYLFTFIIYNISKIGIVYENEEAMKIIRIVFVLIFTSINGYMILPYVFKRLEKINNDEIEKEQLTKCIIIVLIIIALLAIFEISYFGNIQNGIIQMSK